MTTWWLIWDHGEFDHCLDNPGFEVDLVVNTLIDTFAQVWLGGIGLTEAVRGGAIRFEGTPSARHAFLQMLDLRPHSCVKVFSYGPRLAVPPPVHYTPSANALS